MPTITEDDKTVASSEWHSAEFGGEEGEAVAEYREELTAPLIARAELVERQYAELMNVFSQSPARGYLFKKTTARHAVEREELLKRGKG